jgi:hypothetical protein
VVSQVTRSVKVARRSEVASLILKYCKASLVYKIRIEVVSGLWSREREDQQSNAALLLDAIS